MQKNKRNNSRVKNSLALATSIFSLIAAPAFASICLQNFVEFEMVVEEPPIVKLAGEDSNTNFVDVDTTTGTVSNGDSTVDGGSNTLLLQEQITFTCMKGDRAIYNDVLQIQNTDTANWEYQVVVEDNLAGAPAVDDSNISSSGDADIWLFTSTDTYGDTSTTAVNSKPNPATITTNTDWNDDYVQLEIVSGAMSVLDDTMGFFPVDAGEQRQLGLVVDCGQNMDTADTATFRVTINARPL